MTIQACTHIFVYSLVYECLQVSKVQIQLPEIEMLGNFMRQVESCQSRCNKILDGFINLKVMLLNR